MQWINSTDLDNWASSRDCQEYFPLILRRLINATTKDIKSINFPAGNSIVYPGWDGILEASMGNEYIPQGFSVWEIGTKKRVKEKANEDYIKRKKNPLLIEPSQTIYVFITPRIWKDKDKWSKEKKDDNFWKDIRSYDARDIEQWLEQSPAVACSLAKHIEKYPHSGVISLEDWWEEWSKDTNPPISPKLVLAGRTEGTNKVKEWLNNPASLIVIQSPTLDESIAFLAAHILSLSTSEQSFYFSRSLVINEVAVFQHVSVTIKTGLILIPRFDEINSFPLAVQNGHNIYLPLTPTNKVTHEKYILPRNDRDAFVSELKEMGLSEEDSQKYSRDTGRSLTVLKRKLSKANQQPEWAKANTVRIIIPALLAGKWFDSSENDRKIIMELAGESYENYSNKLSLWIHKEDSPILKDGEQWRMQSFSDAWFAISAFITDNDLDKFRKVAIKVLTSIDPRLDLEPEKRWMSLLYGKVSPYTKDLRKGITQTLVLLAVYPDNIQSSLSASTQDIVDNIIKDILQNADWKLWHSLSDVLPLIAEASPNSFLDAVESSLSQDQPAIMGMFSEVKDSITSSSAHPSLLWALESLAWSPQYLGRVTHILGKLARLDPGGKIANRPINSLRDIFILWNPHTHANSKQRLESIDSLLEKEQIVGWHLLHQLMPRYHDSSSPTYKTQWRVLSNTETQTMSPIECQENIGSVTERLLLYVGNDGQRWLDILQNYDSLPPKDRDKVYNQFSLSIVNIHNDRLELWSKLRELLSHHRSYPNTYWALPEPELKKIEKVYFALEPENIIERSIWLFDNIRPNVPEGSKKDHREQELIVNKYRTKVAKEIKSILGLEGFIKLAQYVKFPMIISDILFEIGIDLQEEDELMSLLDNKENNKVDLAKHYIFRKSQKLGHEWIKSQFDTAKKENWSRLKIINFCLSFPQSRFIWDIVESEGIQDSYWKQTNNNIHTLSSEELDYALRQLLHAKRFFTVLDIAALHPNKLTTHLVIKILQVVATEKCEEDIKIDPYDIDCLFEELDNLNEIKDADIAQLEWLYLPVLARVDSTRPPKMLHKELANNPELFVKVLKQAYKTHNIQDNDNIETNEQNNQQALYALNLLRSWKTIPGCDDKGNIDYSRLKSWIDKARYLCAQEDRQEVVDIYIGQVLAYSVSEQEGIWPSETVCRLIDEIQSKDLDDGFFCNINKKRGTVIKSPFEGGEQEMCLSNKYKQYANKWTSRYPRTAKILLKIAQSYENEARCEDQKAERRSLEY